MICASRLDLTDGRQKTQQRVALGHRQDFVNRLANAAILPVGSPARQTTRLS
jgi:hypothetical protein